MSSALASAVRELWADTGGTFTDCLLVLADGSRRRLKVLSNSALRGRVTRVCEVGLGIDLAEQASDDFFVGYELRSPGGTGTQRVLEHENGCLRLEGEDVFRWRVGESCELVSPEEAPVLAARWALGLALDRPLPSLRARLATTRATNALLERRGEPPVLFVTRGFADLLLIGDQRRPELFALRIERPDPLYSEVIEIDARLDSEGEIVSPLELQGLEPQLNRLLEEGHKTAALSLMHSYLRPDQEQELAGHLRKRGFEHVSVSSELAPLIGYLARTETAVIDAYLSPVIDGYISGVEKGLQPESLHLMTSAGGLVRSQDFRARDALLSGPAGGVVGASVAGRRSGFQRLLTFDMGGTSTDVARWAGEMEYVYELRVGGARLVAPAISIETVAAGGGSICYAESGLPKVGPESAGARPGPACYGAGGPLTLTDVNLLLGRLDASRFGIPLDSDAARDSLKNLEEKLQLASEELLVGLLAIADERMAESIRRISVRRGYDPFGHALVAFGGAGGQHACAVASLLGVDTVLSPQDAGILSALGLGSAQVERFAQEQVLEKLPEDPAALEERVERLAEAALQALSREGFDRSAIRIRRRLASLRLEGQESSLEIELGGDPRQAFGSAYEATYGYRPQDDQELELESIRVVASTAVEEAKPVHRPPPRDRALNRDHRAFLAGDWRDVALVDRDRLEAGDRFEGPALVCDPHTTLLVELGWQAEKDGAGAIVLKKQAPESR